MVQAWPESPSPGRDKGSPGPWPSNGRMDRQNGRPEGRKLQQANMFKRRFWIHLFFWALIWASLTWLEIRFNQMDFGFAAGNELIRILFYLVLVYGNIYFLIPRFLNERKLLLYGISLLALVIILTPVMVNVFYWRFQGFPELQAQVVRHQTGYYLLNFLITGAFAIFKIISDWVKAERDSRKIRTETMQSELRFLKSQINPHFLFNTLNSLYALTIRKSDLAPEIVLRLADMMRYMLYECNEKWVPLQREITYMENYLELEKLRHGEKADVHLHVQGEPGEMRVPPLLFIPFLENSFKHGLARSMDKGFVEVVLMIEPDEIHFSITNSKPAQLPHPEAARFGGIGLNNVRKRLDLLYPNAYDLQIENEPLTFRVNLQLKLPPTT